MCPVTSLRVVDGHFSSEFVKAIFVGLCGGACKVASNSHPTILRSPSREVWISLWSDRQLDRLLKEVDR